MNIAKPSTTAAVSLPAWAKAQPHTAASSEAPTMAGRRPSRSLSSQPSAAPAGPPNDISTDCPSERLMPMPWLTRKVGTQATKP